MKNKMSDLKIIFSLLKPFSSFKKSPGLLTIIILTVIVLMTSSCSIKTNTAFENSETLSKKNTEDGLNYNGVVSVSLADVYKDASLASERISQLLYNQPVEVLNTRGENWLKIKTQDITGYIIADNVIKKTDSTEKSRFGYKIVVTARTTKIVSQPSYGSTLLTVVMGTTLFCTGRVSDAYQVALPGNRTGWIQQRGTIELQSNMEIPSTAVMDFISTARKFEGVRYYKGGISAWGIDSAGLIYISFLMNGIKVDRDMDILYENAILSYEQIETDKIRPGDILFFGESKSNQIIDVGIFISTGEFLHSNKAKGAVVKDTIEDPKYRENVLKVFRLYQE